VPVHRAAIALCPFWSWFALQIGVRGELGQNLFPVFEVSFYLFGTNFKTHVTEPMGCGHYAAYTTASEGIENTSTWWAKPAIH